MPLDNLRQICFPYCMQKQLDGRYILNREYKPLGFKTSTIVEYADYPVLLELRVTPKMAANVSFNGSTDTDTIYFYNDGRLPTSDPSYLKRIARLMKWKVKRER